MGSLAGMPKDLWYSSNYPGFHLSRGLAQAFVSSRKRSVPRTRSGLSKSW